MKIWTHRYTLTPKVSGINARTGVLLKIEWALGQIGYSDLHPWPEFGEPDIDVHLEKLTRVELTPLAENSLEFNYIDREYRINRRNAFAGLILPRSHRLVTNLRELEPARLQEWQNQGFTHIKVKMGNDLKTESELLVQLVYSTNLLWRIDFNGKLSEPEFMAWWSGLDNAVKMRIDFIEDPIREGQLKIPGPWAYDWNFLEQARIRVLKPARESIEEFAKYDRVIFTHGMDHTLGQACAAWAAARFYAGHPKKMDVCGLSSPDIYEADEFSRAWNREGPRLKPTSGIGFGFDQILESISWQKIL